LIWEGLGGRLPQLSGGGKVAALALGAGSSTPGFAAGPALWRAGCQECVNLRASCVPHIFEVHVPDRLSPMTKKKRWKLQMKLWEVMNLGRWNKE